LFFSNSSIFINGLKIALPFHPLPLKGEEPAIIPSLPEGEGKGEGIIYRLYYYETVNMFADITWFFQAPLFPSPLVKSD
jgi:hypothetical protein